MRRSEQLDLGFFVRKRVGKAGKTAIAPFDGVFVHCRIKRDRIISVVASHAEGVRGQARSLHHSVLGKVVEGVGIKIFANFLERMIGSHQLASVRKIDAVDAGVHVGRATDEHVNFFRAGFLEIIDARFAGCATHDGVIDDDHAFVFDEFGDEIELHADIKVADELGRLKKAATDVVIANESHLERNGGFE